MSRAFQNAPRWGILLESKLVSLERLIDLESLISFFKDHEFRLFFADNPVPSVRLNSPLASKFVVFGTAIFRPEIQKWLDFILKEKRSWVPLALSAPSNLSDLVSPVRELLLTFFKENGPISVLDLRTQELLNRTLGGQVTVLTPSLSLIRPASLFFENRNQLLFQARSWRPGDKFPRKLFDQLAQQAYRKTSSHRKCLFLANSPDDFSLGAKPGVYTLFQPLFPALHRKCLASARRVLTLNRSTFSLTLPHRVPTVLLGENDGVDPVWHAPVLSLLKARNKDFAEEIEFQFRNYSWQTIEAKIASHRETTSAYLRQHGFLQRSDLVRHKNDLRSLHLCVTADKSYLPSLLGLFENLSEVEPGPTEWHVLVLDSEVESFLETHYRELKIHTYKPEQIWSFSELEVIKNRSVAEMAYSSKPRFTRYVLENVSEPVFYVDADLFFFESPRPLLKEFKNAHTLLFPHWNDRYEHTKKYGQFNAGLFGVRPGAEPFLKWWEKLCLMHCRSVPNQGFYFEQGYLDLAPLNFENIQIYRHGDHNVGPWAIATLGIDRDPMRQGKLKNALGKYIQSFHAAEPDPHGFAAIKSSWDQAALYFSALEKPEDFSRLRENVLHAQKLHWPLARRLCHAKHTLCFRLRLSHFTCSNRFLNLAATQVGRSLIELAALSYRSIRPIYRLVVSSRTHSIPAETHWVQVQRARWLELVQIHDSREKSKRKKTTRKIRLLEQAAQPSSPLQLL